MVAAFTFLNADCTVFLDGGGGGPVEEGVLGNLETPVTDISNTVPSREGSLVKCKSVS